MKRYYAVTVFVSLLTLLAFTFVYRLWDDPAEKTVLKVGFIYENDEITPYTYNFTLAQKALEQAYPGQVEILTRSNVQDDQTEEPLRELVRLGCGVIFSNSYSPQIRALAPEYPEVQFCQVSFSAAAGLEYPANYHTFNGEIYQGRYVTGVAAGMQLRALIDKQRPQTVALIARYAPPECRTRILNMLRSRLRDEVERRMRSSDEPDPKVVAAVEASLRSSLGAAGGK